MQGRHRNDYPCVRKKSVPDLMNSPVIRCRQSIIVRCQLLAAFLTYVQRESAVPSVAPELLQVEETVSHFRAFFNPTNQQVAFDEVDVAKWLATWVVYLLCIDWIEPLTQIHRAVSHEMLPQTIRHWLVQCCDAPCGCTSIMSVIRDLETRLLPIQSAHTLIANNAVDIIPGPGVCHADAPDALDETVAPSVLEAKCSGDDAD